MPATGAVRRRAGRGSAKEDRVFASQASVDSPRETAQERGSLAKNPAEIIHVSRDRSYRSAGVVNLNRIKFCEFSCRGWQRKFTPRYRGDSWISLNQNSLI